MFWDGKFSLFIWRNYIMHGHVLSPHLFNLYTEQVISVFPKNRLPAKLTVSNYFLAGSNGKKKKERERERRKWVRNNNYFCFVLGNRQRFMFYRLIDVTTILIGCIFGISRMFILSSWKHKWKHVLKIKCVNEENSRPLWRFCCQAPKR